MTSKVSHVSCSNLLCMLLITSSSYNTPSDDRGMGVYKSSFLMIIAYSVHDRGFYFQIRGGGSLLEYGRLLE